MAIAAASGSPALAPRRPHRRWWLLAPVFVAVAAAAVGVIAVRDTDAHGSAPSRSSGAARSTPSGSRSGTAPARRGRAVPHRSPGAVARPPDPFTSALIRYLTHRRGDVSAAVEDLRTGREWTYRPGHPEHTASIVKVDILATLLHQHQDDGGLSAENRALATQMIEASSDDDATDLWNEVGGASGVQDLDDAIGMHETTTNVAWGLTLTTPVDQLKLLRTVLFPNPLLDRASRDYEYGLMRSIIPYDTWGVTAGPAGHAKVAFKNGWLPYQGNWQVNSIGSVDGGGRHYLIAVMSVGNPTWDYGIDTIEEISRTAWGDLAPRGTGG